MVEVRVEKLIPSHRLDQFDCGEESLNRFLHRFALQAQASGSSQTWVAVIDDKIVGFYSLVVGSVAHEEAVARLKKGLPQHPVPIMLLARLAVGRDDQGRGIGATLLRDAVLRTLQAANLAGIRALVVHAKDEPAAEFYRRYNFATSPTDPLHLFALLKDLKALGPN